MTNLPALTPQQLPAVVDEQAVTDLRRRRDLLQALMRDTMVEGLHYGAPPGTERPTLLKPGAEMLCSMFRLSPSFDVQLRELPQNHREYTATCTLSAWDGRQIASGIGSATTMESKHRWRYAQRKCPECGVEAIRKGKNGWFCGTQKGGCGVNFPASDKRIAVQGAGKVENPDIADVWNTVLKMAVKRAHTAATLLATAASDLFLLEEEAEEDRVEQAQQQQPEPEPKPRELSAREKLIGACAKAKRALVDAGRSTEGVAELLVEAGVPAPQKSWAELTDEHLEIARKVLEAELSLGKPAAAAAATKEPAK